MRGLIRRVMVFSMVATIGAGTVEAATYTWSGGAAGTWNTSNTNWSGGPATSWDAINGPANVAYFNTASLNSMVSDFIYTNGIIFDQAGTISSGTINLAGTSPSIMTNANGTISSQLGGSVGLTKTGTGLLTLTGPSAYNGATAVSSGTLSIGNGGAGASIGTTSGVALSNNANITFNHSDPVTFSKPISGTGSFTKSGLGTLTLASSQGYNGPTLISGGTVKLVGKVLTPGVNASYFNGFSNYEKLDLAGATYTVPTDRCFAGTQGLLGLTPTTSMINYTGNMSGWGTLPVTHDRFYTGWSGTFTPQGSGDVTYRFYWANDDRGAMFIDKNGDGIFQAGDQVGTNTWHNESGVDVTLAAGTPYNFIYMTADGGGGYNNTWSVSGPGLSQRSPQASDPAQAGMWNNITGSTASNLLPATTPVAITSGATLDLNGTNQQVASLSNLNGSGGTVTNSGANNSLLTISGTGNTAFSGVISDGPTKNVALTLSAGTQTLSGVSTYSGGTIVNGGKLVVDGLLASLVTVGSNAFLSGTGTLSSVTVNDGGHLSPGNSPGTLHLSGDLTLAFGAVMDYELDTPMNSDKILMPTGNLILSGQQFSDFHFTRLDGFGQGRYILIDAESISDNLGGNRSGMIGSYSATLAVEGSDLVLNVVPEPSTLGLLGVGAIGLLGWAWRRRRRNTR